MAMETTMRSYYSQFDMIIYVSMIFTFLTYYSILCFTCCGCFVLIE
jgi:hypothetical protein